MASDGGHPRLGSALRQAWVGYRRRLDDELAAAGYDDRRDPDGRVLRICARSTETTVARIGRELGITRQGAGKLVASLAERGYVTLTASATDRREKTVTLAPRAIEYLAAHRRAVLTIEHRVRTELGQDALDSLHRLLDALGGAGQPRLTEYLRRHGGADLIDPTEE